MPNSKRRDVLKTAGGLAVVGTIAGCAEEDETINGESDDTEQGAETLQDEQEEELGAFRAVHASPDAPNIDVYFDDQPAVEDLGFREVSPYVEVEPSTYQVQITAAGEEETVLYEEEVDVEAEGATTAVAYAEENGEANGEENGENNEEQNGLEVDILEDDITDPGEETSRVRLFHASPDAEEIDIVVSEAPEAAEDEGAQPEDEEQEAPEEEPPDEEEEPEPTQQEGEPAPDEQEQAPEEDEGMPEDGEDGADEGMSDEEPQVGEPLFEGIGFGDSDTQEIPAGDYMLEVVPAEAESEDEEPPGDEEDSPEDEQMPDEEPAPGEEAEEEPAAEAEPEQTQQENEPAPDEEEQAPEEDEEMPGEGPEEEGAEDQEPVEEFELTTESQTVYSAFAVGYVDSGADEESEDGEPEDDGEDEDILQENGEEEENGDQEFEVIIVEDAREGERADGGTEEEDLLILQY